MVYRNTHFCDYLVYLSEQFHTSNSNLSHVQCFNSMAPPKCSIYLTS